MVPIPILETEWNQQQDIAESSREIMVEAIFVLSAVQWVVPGGTSPDDAATGITGLPRNF